MDMEAAMKRIPPHSAEAEQAVLGSMLIDARCVPEVIDQLRRAQVDTLSPLEALNLLYELKKKLS